MLSRHNPSDHIGKSVFKHGIPWYSVSPEEHPLLTKVIDRWPFVHSTYNTHDLGTCSFKTCYNSIRRHIPRLKFLRNLKYLNDLPIHPESSCLLDYIGHLLVNLCSLFKEKRLQHTDPLLLTTKVQGFHRCIQALQV